jgi:hypothetical protein
VEHQGFSRGKHGTEPAACQINNQRQFYHGKTPMSDERQPLRRDDVGTKLAAPIVARFMLQKPGAASLARKLLHSNLHAKCPGRRAWHEKCFSLLACFMLNFFSVPA